MAGLNALVRTGFIEFVTPANLEAARVAGYDLLVSVDPNNRIEGMWLVNATAYPALPLPTTVVNQNQMESDADTALAALRTFRDNASPSNAQVISCLKTVCRVLIALIRFRLNKLDASN